MYFFKQYCVANVFHEIDNKCKSQNMQSSETLTPHSLLTFAKSLYSAKSVRLKPMWFQCRVPQHQRRRRRQWRRRSQRRSKKVFPEITSASHFRFHYWPPRHQICCPASPASAISRQFSTKFCPKKCFATEKSRSIQLLLLLSSPPRRTESRQRRPGINTIKLILQ